MLWQKVEEETGRGRERWKARDLFAEGGQCAQAMLDFLSLTDVGKTVPPGAEEGDGGSEASEGELRERAELEDEKRSEERGAEDKRGAGEERRCSYPPRPSWHRWSRGGGDVRLLCDFLGALSRLRGTGLGGGQ